MQNLGARGPTVHQSRIEISKWVMELRDMLMAVLSLGDDPPTSDLVIQLPDS
jgi:hypothetical protein